MPAMIALASANADSKSTCSPGFTGRRAYSRITGTACPKSTCPYAARKPIGLWPLGVVIGRSAETVTRTRRASFLCSRTPWPAAEPRPEVPQEFRLRRRGFRR